MPNPETAFARDIMHSRYSHDVPFHGYDPETNDYVAYRKEDWDEIADRTAGAVMGAVKAPPSLICEVAQAIREKKFIPGGRYLFASGRPFHQVQNCLLMRVQDTREGWGEHLQHSMLALMTGAGIGADYSALRPENSPLCRGGGQSSGPIALMQMTNELGRGARQGGARRGAIWAGLSWKHPDIFKFIHIKDWPEEVKRLKEQDFNFPATLDYTNISVILDDEFFLAYKTPWHPDHAHARKVYWLTVRSMLETGEPGFSVNTGKNAGETLRNACTEITSADDSDICHLGSINLARVSNLAEMSKLVELGTAFLLAGTVYSDVPYPKVADVRQKNRRLGLGLMGIHEWLLVNGLKYGPSDKLESYLQVYTESTQHAERYATRWDLSTPVKTRAIAPNGTIGIIAETTTSAEPLYAAAYKRRYREGNQWNFQFVVDSTARRLVERHGVKPSDLESAYTLAEDPRRRIAFQAYLQRYVDHSISSTVNLPAWGTPLNNKDRVTDFGNMLMEYLPDLRGITVYPDGSRGGQPLTVASYEEAISHEGEVFHEGVDICDITRGGGCGS